MQNNKTLHDYEAYIQRGELPVTKGYFLNEEDLRFKQYILDVSCNGTVQFDPIDQKILQERSFPILQQLQEDGLLLLNDSSLQVSSIGRNFIRNICRAFDLHLLRSATAQQDTMFSKAV